MSKRESLKKDFLKMIEIEEEDIFDGVSQGDISSKEWDSFVESLSRDKGILWEETVK